uniref:Immunoglobulin V-set domain-containing protein n=1 Tax=Ursus maritimus TaxID=29073 RepID=A0A452UW83_URSMA
MTLILVMVLQRKLMGYIDIYKRRIIIGIGTGAQLVTQPDAHVTPYLYWFVQYPNQGLQLLLQYISGNTLVQGIKGFKAEFKDSETSFHLKKPSAHGSDSAVYLCAASDTVPGTAGGAGHKPLETLSLKRLRVSA